MFKTTQFQTKIHLALLGVTTVVLLLFALGIERVLKNSIQNEFIQRYTAMSRIVADSLIQLETASEIIIKNAVNYLQEIEKSNGLPTETELDALKRKMHVSALVIVDKSGTIIRDTETAPRNRTNFFALCQGYRRFFTDPSYEETTPILPSYSTKEVYKFAMISNFDHSRILEAGIELTFISDILKNTIKSDKNIVSVSLFTPSGYKLGHIGKQSLIDQPRELESHEDGQHYFTTDDTVIITREVPAPYPQCCECKEKLLSSADGSYYYKLRIEVSTELLKSNLRKLRGGLLSGIFILFIFTFVVAKSISKAMVRKLRVFYNTIQGIIRTGDISVDPKIEGEDEISQLATAFNEMMRSLKIANAKLMENERVKSLGTLAGEVAHDIRSPLAALEMFIKIHHDLPEDSRTLARSAVSRIGDIASNLLNKYKNIMQPSDGNLEKDIFTPSYLAPLIESILAEKRFHYRGELDIDFEFRIEDNARDLFSILSSIDFKRIISNLINNSVEAITGAGRVRITLSLDYPWAIVSVWDTGKGIPAEIMPQLGTVGFSYQKENGTGLGLSHAKRMLENWGGSIQFSSQVGVGTTVDLKLPVTPAPEWFQKEIEIHEEDTVVIIDDDASIHQVWIKRFSEVNTSREAVKLIHFSSPTEFKKWYQKQSPQSKIHFKFLVDFDLIDDSVSGLSLILQLGISSQSTLVTSHFASAEIVSQCILSGVSLLPKSLCAFVNIRVLSENSDDHLY